MMIIGWIVKRVWNVDHPDAPAPWYVNALIGFGMWWSRLTSRAPWSKW